MKHFLVQIKGLALLMLLSLSLSVSAATLPAYYPETFQMHGTVDRIDIKRGEIVINDMFWSLSMNVKVHSLTTEFSSIQTLRLGMNIGFSMNTVNGKNQVAEIWILPDNNTLNSENTE